MGVCFPPQPGIQGLDPRIKVDLFLIWGLAFSPACSYLNKNWGEGLLGTWECPGAKEAGRLSEWYARGTEVREAASQSLLDGWIRGNCGPEFPARA